MSREIRTPTPADIPRLLQLLDVHVARGALLPRTAESIRDTLPHWLIGVAEGQVVACGSLLHYTPYLAEVRSLAVADTVQGGGWGTALVTELIALAEQQRIPTLFALTRVVYFFQRLGFTVTAKERFPEKVWRDCAICPLKENCDETAVVLQLAPVPAQIQLSHINQT